MQVLVTRIDTYCDICKSAGKDTHADPEDAIKLVIRNKPMRLDVCGNHKNPRWQDIEASMIPDIDPAAKPASMNGSRPTLRIPCPIDGCDFVATKSARSLSMHLTTTHADIAMEDRRDLYLRFTEGYR